MNTSQMNNLPLQNQKPIKPKFNWPMLISFLLILLVIGTGIFFYQSKDKDIIGDNGQDIFVDDFETGFSKLIISSANAEDNFSLDAKKIDSLGVEVDTSYVLKSKDSVSMALIKESLKIEPEIKYDIKEVSNKEWEIIPNEELESNTLIKVSMAASYLTDDGEKKEVGYSWAFQVKDSFKVIHSIPRELGTNVPLNSGIEVTFSHDNFKDIEKHFEINPVLPGRFEKHGRTAVFVAEKNMTGGLIYTVTVKASLGLDGSDEILGEDYSFAFETKYNDPKNLPSSNNGRISVSNTFIESSSQEAPIIKLYAYNLKKGIQASVYKFNGLEDYFHSVKERDKLPWWSNSKDRYVEDVSKLNKILEVDLDVISEDRVTYIQFPEKFEKGFYILELEGPSRTHQLWLQVSDLATYYTITKKGTIFWVNSVATGGPVANASISIIDTALNYQTDTKGVVQFSIPEKILGQAVDLKYNERKYFKISSTDDTLILPASPISYRYSWRGFNSSATVDYWNYLYTDRPMYQTTDKIQYWGLLKNREGSSIQEDVTMTLSKRGYVDYYYRPVHIVEQKLDVSSDGTFLGEIDIENLRPDSYTLELKIGDKVIRTKYINIKPYTKPTYTLSITPDNKRVFIDDKINLKVKASFFEGTPVPNLKLKFKMPEGVYDFTTDINGEADLSYEKDYAPCKSNYNCWPKRVNLSIYPANSELAEIRASTNVSFYAPNVYMKNKVTYPEKGLTRVEIDSKFIDLESMDNKNWWQRNQGDAIAPNIKVEGELTKITYTKVETGTKYDYINKKTYKTYRYNREEAKEDSFVVYTDADGHYSYDRLIEESTSYKLQLKIYDDKGYYDNYTNYLYYYNGKYIRHYNSPRHNYYYLKLDDDEKNVFDVGETVAVSFMNGEELMPDKQDSYLYLQLQNGLQGYLSASQAKYAFDFQKKNTPNVYLRAIYFNGTSYITSQPKSIIFDKEKKRLKISISTDKDLYKPGEKARIDFDVRDINDRPVQAELNVNLVDEAFYAIVDEEASPLSTIYSSIGEGVLSTKKTHESAVVSNDAFGAEKGCFAAGTEILMADGTKKSIEDIKPGDKVTTFSDYISQQLVEGEVSKVWEHTIAKYFIINEILKVTPEHLVFANGRFMDAASLKRGDWMLDSNGEKVFVETIEPKFEIIKVYNFEVEPYHTYFADGFFVHNEKGGGPREFFVDTALFNTVKTNSLGQGHVVLTLPDNITSWRVTAQAVSRDIDVGVATEKIPVSLPVFAEATIGMEYLVADKPIARLRAFGTALEASDQTSFFINASSLGLEKSNKQSSKAFESVYFPLPALQAGSHDIVYNLESSKGDDAILLPINVIESRVAAQVAKSEKLTLDTEVAAMNELPFAVILSDLGQNQLYRPLQKLSWTYGSRVDQALPSKQARELLNKYYDYEYNTSFFNAFDYQMNTGGITLLPYSSEDLELSARVAAVGADGFDKESLSQYFYKVLGNRSSNQEEISYALFGLAALEKPVLARINIWLQNEKLGPKEKLYLAQALFILGDKYRSKDLYLEVMEQFAEVKEPVIKIKVSDNFDDIFHTTALGAVVASFLDAPEASGLWAYLDKNQSLYGINKNSENLFTLERINYIKDAISKLKPSPANVSYELASRKRVVNITGGSTHSFQLHPEHVDQLKFLEIEGDVGITMSYTVPINPVDIEVDDDIQVSREYYVDGVKTNNFKDSDLIEVRLTANISDNALHGYYQITDILPSGLMPVTKVQNWYSRYDCTYRYPYNSFGQTVKYKINKNWYNSKCGDFIKYYARVRNKGTYIAEPAIIQSFTNPDYINYSSKEIITIK